MKGFTAKNWIALICLFVCALLLPFAFSGGWEQPTKTNEEAFVLEVWNVDTFEGGRNSRADFLRRCANTFSKQSGTRVLVKHMTIEQFRLNFANARPNVLSFGSAIAEEAARFLVPFEGTVHVRDELFASGMRDGSAFAIAWCMGGYGTLTKENAKGARAVIGVAEGCAPLCAAYFTKGGPTAVFGEALSQLMAYEAFVNGAADVLLGSQRDFVRVSERIKRGTMESVTFTPLSGYTDLVQYLAVVANEDGTAAGADFITFMTEECCQKELYRIGMFPTIDGVRIYTQPPFSEMETALSHPLRIPNVFLSEKERETLQNCAKGALLGAEKERKFLDNFIW